MSGSTGGGAGLEQLLGMLAGGGNGGAQGLGTLVDRLRQGGLGEEVDSWVGTGTNKPVAPDRLAGVFGQDELAGVAQRLGAGAGGGGGMAAMLAALLPQLINGLTPQGRVPQSDAEFGRGGMGGMLSQVMGALSGSQQGGGGATGGGLGALLGALTGSGGDGSSAGGLGALLGGLMGGGGAAPQPSGQPGMEEPPQEARSSKPGLGGDGGGPLPQKPRPLR